MLLRSAVLVLLSLPLTARAEPPAVEAFAGAILLGVQLSAKHGEQRGAISAAESHCIQALQPPAFYPTIQQVMAMALTSEEAASANRFFSTTVGQKYAKHGLLQAYPAMGEQPPEPLPEFSSAEYRLLEAFAASSAGQALIARQVMQSQTAKQSYSARILQLVEECRGK